MNFKNPALFAIAAILLLFAFYFVGQRQILSITGSVDSNNSFLDLNDTPDTYVGQGTKLVRVNPGATALEFFAASGITDTNCDSNPACHLLLSTVVWDNNTVPDARYVNVTGDTMTGNLNGTSFVASKDVNAKYGKFDDLNYGLLDANGAQSCPVGQALQSVGNVTSCIVVGGSSSGDLNWVALNQVIPWADVNVSDTITAINYVTTTVFNNSFPVNWDTNISNRPSIPTDQTIDANVWDILQGSVPWQDANVANNITVDWTGLQNYPTGCSPGDFVSTIGDTLTCGTPTSTGVTWTQINAVVPWQDVNVADNITVTGYVTTSVYNAGWPVADANITTLSWTKLQNYPTGCGAFLAVGTIGDTLTCISVPSETNIDGNISAAMTGDLLGTANQVIVNGGVNLANVLFGASNATFTLPQDIHTTASVSFSILTLSTRLTTLDLNSTGVAGFNRANFIDLNATRGTIKDLNVTIDLNVGDDLLVNDDVNAKSDVGIDGNLSLNTLGAKAKFKTNTGPFCLYGNDFDANGGLVFASC